MKKALERLIRDAAEDGAAAMLGLEIGTRLLRSNFIIGLRVEHEALHGPTALQHKPSGTVHSTHCHASVPTHEEIERRAYERWNARASKCFKRCLNRRQLNRSRNLSSPRALQPRGDGNGLDMWWTVMKEAATDWSSHKDARQGAALAYYSVFSLGPIIVIAIAVAGLLFGHDVATAQVMSSIKEMLGDTGAKAVEAMLAGADRPTAGIVASILGIGALLFAAIGVVVQLKDALNVVWEVEQSKETGLWHFARNYVLSFAAALSLGFLLLVSLLVSAGLAAAGKHASTYLPEGVLHIVTMLVSFVVGLVLFAMICKWLPDVAVGWRDVWVGAFLTAVFFEIGKAVIGFYIGKQGLESTYGAATSIVVVLIWVYYTSQIILMGAEITHNYAKQNGSLREGVKGMCS